MEVLYVILGLVLGVLLFVIMNRKRNPEAMNNEIQNQFIESDKKNAVLNALLEELEKKVADTKSEAESKIIEQRDKYDQLKEQIEKHASDKLNALQQRFDETEKAKIKAETSLLEAREHFMQQEKRIKEQKDEIEKLNERFQKEFENIANRILDDKSKRFTEQNKSNLDALLNPLKERIQIFEKKVDESYKLEASERNSLKGEIKSLLELNARISQEANNLAKALKGDNKLQGNWGEKVLESILEGSGLLKNQMYKTQESLTNAAGDIIKPDAIVYLPEQKHIIIDSKVSLIAYNQFIAEEKEEEKVRWLKEHVISIKSHVKLLAEKNYYTSRELNTPEFVLMFVPIESSFALALQTDLELFNYAWERRIIIVSPSTLQATLMTVSSIWKQEMQTRNAIEIATEGGKLYDKFASFMEDLKKIKTNLDRSNEAYDAAMNKLSTGKGNLLNRVEHLRKLGAKTTKQINESLPGHEEDNDNENSSVD